MIYATRHVNQELLRQLANKRLLTNEAPDFTLPSSVAIDMSNSNLMASQLAPFEERYLFIQSFKRIFGMIAVMLEFLVNSRQR